MELKLKARAAKKSDLMLVFNWANDPLTREMSFNQAPIPLETHKEWFGKTLSSRNMHLLIIEACKSNNWVPIAQIRFSKDGEVSMSLAKEFRGQHLAALVIRTGITYIKNKLPTKNLIARIKPQNIPSIKAFQSAGFIQNHLNTQEEVKLWRRC